MLNLGQVSVQLSIIIALKDMLNLAQASVWFTTLGKEVIVQIVVVFL